MADRGPMLVIGRTPGIESGKHRYDVVDRTGRTTLPANTTVIGLGRQSIYVVIKDELDLETLQRRPWP